MVATKMVFFGNPYDGFYDVWEAATATAALGHDVINGARDNQPPAIFIEKLYDDGFDVFISNNIAAAD